MLCLYEKIKEETGSIKKKGVREEALLQEVVKVDPEKGFPTHYTASASW